MNTVWSDCIQNTGTLYFSRMLRFSDRYREQYKSAFRIHGQGRMLEIGCGPGALAQSLARWYPEAQVLGVDRDACFVEFAKKQAPELQFLEADATQLPFEDNSFDVAISNTVQEHVEPARFFQEQRRILKPGGICLVLSARRGINIVADCISAQSDFEKEIWARVEPFCDRINRECHVGQYAMSESELPAAMEEYGFREVSTDYLTVNLTPDHPENSKEVAYAMIHAHYQTHMDAVNSLTHVAPGVVSEAEVCEMRKLVEKKYQKRFELYDAGKKQWDASVSMTMVLRGVK